MKTASIGLGALMLVCMIGCKKQSEPGGGTTKADQVKLSDQFDHHQAR